MAEPILSLRDVRVRFRTLDGIVDAVKGVALDVNAGETVAIVGESGSGKSQLMMAAMGLLASNGEAIGTADYRGRNLLGMSKSELNTIRGRKITMIFQEPMTSLDPLYRIGSQLMEPIIHHQRVSGGEAHARAVELLKLVRIPEPERRMRSYPYELSGGQRQRVMIAMAIANDPDILIADEPTTALDVTIQAEILDLMAGLQKRLGMGLIFITHDLNIVRRIAASRLCHALWRSGGAWRHQDDLLRAQASLYPGLARRRTDRAQGPRRQDGAPHARRHRHPRDLPSGRRLPFRRSHPICAPSIASRSHCSQGQTIGIVGESGSGKSTLARAMLRLLPSEGAIHFDGRDIAKLDKDAMRPLRKELQIVLQDPFGSLSPRMTAGPDRHRRVCSFTSLRSRPRSAIGAPRWPSRKCNSIRNCAIAIRMNSPAASASASPLPAPSS